MRSKEVRETDERQAARHLSGASVPGGYVCLTFDDGPDPTWTPRLLDLLREADAPATFFVISTLAQKYPELVGRMISEGHEVALHCERHIRHTEMTPSEIAEDTRRGLAALASLGISPTRWRPPWGVVAEGTGRVAAEFGLRVELWDADTHDWRGDPAEEMLRSIRGRLTDGCVILMHDGLGPGATRTGCANTLDLVRLMPGEMGKRDLTPATLSQLADRRPEKTEVMWTSGIS